jgi:hypothetical protein
VGAEVAVDVVKNCCGVHLHVVVVQVEAELVYQSVGCGFDVPGSKVIVVVVQDKSEPA